ncbi:ATP-binding protein [Sunxiuqinia sp. A32]|uniref:ATP-binding protein n=1 Tax=Sunxiuqinia sp. A32 TaxID=3461496 RepID=UPI004046501A
MNELALHILDIAQNSTRAKAKLIQITIIENTMKNEYSIIIEDDGAGMSQEEVVKVVDPFYTSRTTRKVGLGIPLLKHTAEQTEGTFNIKSEKGKGTKLEAHLKKKHIDRPILGDIAGTLMILVSNESDADIVYQHQTDKGEYEFDTREVKNSLDGMPITTPEIRQFIKEMIVQNLEQIQISE